jgi:hypothetical protein
MRITVLIHSGDSPWDRAEVRGRVTGTIAGDAACVHIDELSPRDVGSPDRIPIGPQGRVILQVSADWITTPARLR